MEKDMNLYVGGGVMMLVLIILIIFTTMGSSNRSRAIEELVHERIVIPTTPIPFTALTNELVVPNNSGVVLQAGTNAIRVAGSSTTSFSGGTTTNQIQKR